MFMFCKVTETVGRTTPGLMWERCHHRQKNCCLKCCIFFRSVARKWKEVQADRAPAAELCWVTVLNLRLLNLTAGPDSGTEVWPSAWWHGTQLPVREGRSLLSSPLPVLFCIVIEVMTSISCQGGRNAPCDVQVFWSFAYIPLNHVSPSDTLVWGHGARERGHETDRQTAVALVQGDKSTHPATHMYTNPSLCYHY